MLGRKALDLVVQHALPRAVARAAGDGASAVLVVDDAVLAGTDDESFHVTALARSLAASNAVQGATAGGE
jgi:hypothetical protein